MRFVDGSDVTNEDETQPHALPPQPAPPQARWQPPTWPAPPSAPAGSAYPPPPTGPAAPPPGPVAPPPGPGWAGQQQAPPAWQQQPQAQWPYVQPGQWSPGYDVRPGDSTVAVIGAVILLVMGSLVGLFGLLFLLVGTVSDEMFEQMQPEMGIPIEGLATLLFVVGVVMIVFALAQLIAGIGVFLHKAWARWMGVVSATFGLLFGVLMLLGLFSGPVTAVDLGIVAVWLIVYGFAIYGLAAGGAHFRPRYPGR